MSEEKKDEIVDLLKEGELMIYPTDTVAGIGGIYKKEICWKINLLKKRDGSKFLSAAFGTLKQITEYTNLDSKAYEILKKNLPGPFTFVVNLTEKGKEKLEVEQNTIGIRIIAGEISQIIRKLGHPIVTTSANISGEKVPTVVENLNWKLIEKIGVLIKWDYELSGKPSTIVDLSGNKNIILRDGGHVLKV